MRSERKPSELVPWGRHLDDWTVARDGGAQIRMFQVSGLPHELEPDGFLLGMTDRLNRVHMDVADPRLTFSVHMVKLMEPDVPEATPLRSYWPRLLDQDYREKVLGPGLSRNLLYVGLAYEPEAPMGRWMARRAMPKEHRASPRDRQAMKDIAATVEENLAAYGIAPLGMRFERHGRRGVWFSQVAEAAFAILYGRYERVPIPAGPLSDAILRDRPIFVRGDRTFEVRTPGATSKAKYFGAIAEFTGHPAMTGPGMLDGLLDFPCNLVMSATFGYRSKSQSTTEMEQKEGQMTQAGDKARGQISALSNAQEDLFGDKWVRGTHHLSVAVYSPTLDGLDEALPKLRQRMIDSGGVVGQQDWNLEAAWAAQLPGGWHKVKRKVKLTSENFADYCPLHNYPAGDTEQRWGSPIWDFRTSGRTLYRHNLHHGEVGSTLVLGQTGKGKSVLLNTMLIGAVERLGARAAFFDKDFGSKPCIKAMGGAYLELGHGQRVLAPLAAASDTPDWRAHIVRLMTGCIHEDAPPGWEMSPDEQDSLARGVARQLKMPAGLRSWGGVRNVMGWRDRKGAGARLERWCDGGERGWVFDNREDKVDLSRRCVGFDTTRILSDPSICGPILSHLAFRAKALMDGSRFTLFWDEAAAALRIPQFEAMIADELATIRKNEGVVVLASQGPGPLLASKIGGIIREQTPTKIAFEVPDADWGEFQQLGFTRPMFDLVRIGLSVGRKRFVMSRPGSSAVLDFDLSPIKEHLWLLSGRASTCRELDRIIAEVGDDPEKWVPIFMKRAPLVVAQEAARESAARAAEQLQREPQEIAA